MRGPAVSLVQWLLAQIDKDQKRAELADEGWYDPSHAGACETCDAVRAVPDPARVLRECAAKRQIVQRFIDGGGLAVGRGSPEALGALEEAMLILATIYADRPGYRDEWRVEGVTE